MPKLCTCTTDKIASVDSLVEMLEHSDPKLIKQVCISMAKERLPTWDATLRDIGDEAAQLRIAAVKK